jgi:hypothetical protein
MIVKSLLKLIFFLIIVLSQFYFNQSGLQPQHSLIIFFLLLIFSFIFKNKINKSFVSPFIFPIFFVTYAFLINLFFFLTLSNDMEFLISSFTFIAGFVIIFSINFFIAKFNQQDFLKQIFFFSILILFIAYLFKYSFVDFDGRFQGYFSNPNQMAHWILCASSSYLLLFNSYQNFKIKIIFIITVSIILILATQSRGAFIAIPILLIGTLINYKNFKIIIFFNLFLLLLLIIFLRFESILNIFNRLVTTDFQYQLFVRGYTRLIDFPYFLIFGAGQGLHSRFIPLINDIYYEVHSLPAGIIFYYGIFGFFIFFIFLYNLFKSLSLGDKFIMLAPFIYSLTDFTSRTFIFWVFLGVCLYKSKFANTKKKYIQ